MGLGRTQILEQDLKHCRYPQVGETRISRLAVNRQHRINNTQNQSSPIAEHLRGSQLDDRTLLLQSFDCDTESYAE